MLAKEIRVKTVKELHKDLKKLRLDLEMLKMQINAGKSKDIKQKRVLRKDIAKVKTIISEKEVLSQNEKA